MKLWRVTVALAIKDRQKAVVAARELEAIRGYFTERFAPLHISCRRVIARTDTYVDALFSLGSTDEPLFTFGLNRFVKLLQGEHPYVAFLRSDHSPSRGVDTDVADNGSVIHPIQTQELDRLFSLQLQRAGEQEIEVPFSCSQKWMSALSEGLRFRPPPGVVQSAAPMCSLVGRLPFSLFRENVPRRSEAALPASNRCPLPLCTFSLQPEEQPSHRLSLSRVRISARGNNTKLPSQIEEYRMSAEIQEYEVDAISQEAEVEVVLGSIAISSDELVLLRPGVAIEISMDESLPVAVRVGGRTIGRATLAVSDNQLMLTVFEMLE